MNAFKDLENSFQKPKKTIVPNVGIGTTTPGAALEVISNPTATAATTYAQKTTLNYSPASASTQDSYGLSVTAKYAGGLFVNSTGSIIAVEGKAENASSAGSIGTLIGGNFQATNGPGQDVTTSYGTKSYTTGAATVGTSYGVYSEVNRTSNTLFNAYGVYGLVSTTGGAAPTINSAYALYGAVSKPVGTIGTGYGLYTGTIAATNKWSVYASDATAPSYFAGNVGIGTSAPTSKLHVVGSTPAAGAAENVLTAVGGTGAANSAGGGVTLTGGTGNGPGAGGAFSLVAGTGGSTGNGGGVMLSAGNGGATSGVGGGVTIKGGDGPAQSNSGTVSLLGSTYGTYGGAAISLYGSGSVTTGTIALTTASGNGVVGNAGGISIATGSSGGGMSGNGGGFSVTTGNGDSTGSGGVITLTAGAGGASNVNGANVVLNGGAKGGSGSDGNVVLANTRGNVGIGNPGPTYKLDVTGAIRTTQSILNSSSVPTISVCGTSPPAATTGSNNNSGQFTLGTGATAACTVTFADPFPTNAFCTLTPASNYTGTYYLSAQSRNGFTVTLGTGTASVMFNYTCGGN